MGLNTLVIINPLNGGNDHQRLNIALLSTVIADGNHLLGCLIYILLGNFFVLAAFSTFGVGNG